MRAVANHAWTSRSPVAKRTQAYGGARTSSLVVLRAARLSSPLRVCGLELGILSEHHLSRGWRGRVPRLLCLRRYVPVVSSRIGVRAVRSSVCSALRPLVSSLLPNGFLRPAFSRLHRCGDALHAHQVVTGRKCYLQRDDQLLDGRVALGSQTWASPRPARPCPTSQRMPMRK